MVIALDGEKLTIPDIVRVARDREPVKLSPAAAKRMRASLKLVETMGQQGRVAYGVHTGIGKLASVRIPEEDLLRLQLNIVRSHSAGVGRPLPADVVRAMMAIRANGLAKGYSGIRPLVVETLVEMLNRGVHPIVPRKGSVGASGDLAPLAHLASVMVGEGEATYDGDRLPGLKALGEAGITPLELQAKEGLAIINGTALMAAYGSLALHDGLVLAKSALIAGSLSFESLRGSTDPLDPRIQAVRPHPGQAASARILLRLLADSALLPTPADGPTVQDAYTLRCMPQVFGACLDVLRYAEGVLGVEINAATDNPLLFPEEGAALSCGNFHGQPLAFVLDFLAIALGTLGAFAERRIARLVDGHLSELPPFLTEESGLHSGLMLAQYTAAALASENKVLAHPASADSIPTSANQEDFVPMGPAAGEKLRQVVRNVQHVLALELLCGAQALEFLRPSEAGVGTRVAYDLLRAHVQILEEDRPLTPDVERIRRLVADGILVEAVEGAVGPLDLT